ncbi:MAG: DUF177 domain-containing protein [Thermodesulfobacteriota bacterium]|nr:DUF177 domain-containing protein [Thermodesulfobacteriota bacterium]
MKIKVHDIPQEGLSCHVEYGREILQDITQVQEPIAVNIKIERAGRDIRVMGDIKTRLLLNCSRCLEDFAWALADEFDFLLMLPTGEKGYPEIELSPEDMDVSFFDGETVDVAQIAAEQIFLQMPVKPLCHEECKGLCPHCGVNLNLTACDCRAGATFSPFEALRDIKLKDRS